MVTVRTKLQMKELIPISKLNDFDFCPYSIYLQNVYMDTDEDLYRAQPQTRGNNAHENVDKKGLLLQQHCLIDSINFYYCR